jgi:hypothetical protein
MAAVSVDDYLADLPDDRRRAREAIRQAIRQAAPGANETIA